MTTFSVAPPPPPTSFPLAPHLPICDIFNHSYYLPYRCWELSRTLLLSSFQCCCLFLVLLLFFCFVLPVVVVVVDGGGGGGRHRPDITALVDWA